MTKAQQVREMIALAKGRNEALETLIQPVMQQFGFARQLARAYLKNNWDKVEAKIQEVVAQKPTKTLSMSKDAIRKREARAAKKAAAQLQNTVLPA